MAVGSPTDISAGAGWYLCATPRTGVRPRCLALLLAVAAAACSGPAATTPVDGAAVTGTDRLEPSGSNTLGLAYGAGATLAVRYLDARGDPRSGVRVGFSLSGDAGGAALSASDVATGADGIAAVGVHAGHRDVTFQVHAGAPGVDDVVFLVAVNKTGVFADLAVRATFPGAPPAGLVVRLYDAYACADLPASSPPPAAPPRTIVAGPADTVEFTTLLTGRAYAVLIVPSVEPLTVAGCVDLLPDRLIANATTLVLVPLHAPRPALGSRYALSTRIPLAPVAPLARPFGPLACPAAPGELLLDCLIDAADLTDDSHGLDCIPDPAHDLTDPLSQILNAHRRPADASGCRGTSQDPGLDALVHAQLVAAAPALGAALAQLARPEVVGPALAALQLESELALEPASASDWYLGTHTLLAATLGDPAGSTLQIDLTTVGLPARIAAGVPVIVGADGTMSIHAHGFSLRFGALAHAALAALVLEPNGLPAGSPELLDELVAAVTAGAGDACAALGALVCGAVGLPADCLGARCALALAAAPGAIDAPLRAFDGGEDLALSGTATPQGAAGQQFLNGGVWTAALGPGPVATVAASFTGSPVATPVVRSPSDSSWGEEARPIRER
jgi:hypothetical protein